MTEDDAFFSWVEHPEKPYDLATLARREEFAVLDEDVRLILIRTPKGFGLSSWTDGSEVGDLPAVLEKHFACLLAADFDKGCSPVSEVVVVPASTADELARDLAAINAGVEVLSPPPNTAFVLGGEFPTLFVPWHEGGWLHGAYSDETIGVDDFEDAH